MKPWRNNIGGEWVTPAAADYRDLTNPATGEMLGRVPLSGAREVNEAVAAAQAAFLKWREGPPGVRGRYLFKLKYLMDQQFDEIAPPGTPGNGKTNHETRGPGRPGTQDVQPARGGSTLMNGQSPPGRPA